MTSTIESFDLSEPTPFNVARHAWLRVLIELAVRGGDATAATLLEQRIATGAWTLTAGSEPGTVRVVITPERAPLLEFGIDWFNAKAQAIVDRCPPGLGPGHLGALYRALLASADDVRDFEAQFDGLDDADLDASNRPLVVPAGAGPNNAVATVGGPAAEGAVGTWHGLPVYLDANIPTNLGTGTNEDRILVGRFSDAMLFEGVPRMRVLPEVGSGTLTVRIQVYNYVAFAPGRFPAGISIVAGTGLATPTF